MSIIQEALKKAQQKITSSTPIAKEPKNENIVNTIYTSQPSYDYTPPVPVAKDKPVNRTATFLIVAVLLVGVVIIYMMHKHAMKAGPAIDASRQVVTYKPKQEKPASTLPAPEKAAAPAPIASLIRGISASQPSLILNGIMYLTDNPKAIINNCIVSEGETVDGATVVKINKNNVVLNFNDTEITLKLKE